MTLADFVTTARTLGIDDEEEFVLRFVTEDHDGKQVQRSLEIEGNPEIL